MIPNRRVVLAAVGLTFSLVVVGRAEVVPGLSVIPDLYPPGGGSFVGRGTNLNEDGRGLKGRVLSIAGAISIGKMDQATAGLNSLFGGSALKGGAGDSPAVVAGGWAAGPSLEGNENPGAKVVPVGLRRSLTEKAAEYAAAKAAQMAIKQAEKYANRDQRQESIDAYGGSRMKHLKTPGPSVQDRMDRYDTGPHGSQKE